MTPHGLTFRSRILVASIVATIAVATLGDGASSSPAVRTQRTSGPARFAFHYSPSLSSQQIDWYSHFDLLVTHDPLPRDQVERLHRAGTRVLLYEWAAAFYETRATPWQKSLLRERKDLLNQTPLTGGSGGSEAAWYFDPNTHAHQFGRAEALAGRIRDAGYDGVFLDATTVTNVHSEARREFAARHPSVQYDPAFSRFLIELRRKLPEGVLFTNQGYRSAAYYLPYVDWDLTESLIAGPSAMQSWNNPGDPSSDISVAMRDVRAIAERYPHVRFGHLNYFAGEGDESDGEERHDLIRLVVATTQLFDAQGYVASNTRDERDRIYLRDPGKPLGDRVDLPGRRGSYRVFENGIVAINAGNHEVVIEHRQTRTLRDHITGERIAGRTLALPASAGQPRAYFYDFDSILSSSADCTDCTSSRSADAGGRRTIAG